MTAASLEVFKTPKTRRWCWKMNGTISSWCHQRDKGALLEAMMYDKTNVSMMWDGGMKMQRDCMMHAYSVTHRYNTQQQDGMMV